MIELPAGNRTTAERSHPHVLLVDDNVASRYALRRHLESRGFTVTEAGDGTTVLGEVVGGLRADLFILDVNLPDMSGFEICRRLRAMPTVSRIPILQISATSIDPESQVVGLESGADAYLVAPIDPSVVVATARALLRAARAERDAAQHAREWQVTFDAVTNPVCLLDAEGKVIRANAAFAELVGRVREECLGVAFEEAIDPAGETRELRAFAAVVATGARQIREGAIGGHWHRLMLDPIRDESGAPVRVVATLTDLEDRRKAELQVAESVATQQSLFAAAQEARQLLEAIVHQLPVALAVVEARTGRLLVANARVAATFGVREGMVTDYMNWPGLHPDGTPYAAGEWPIARTLATGETIDAEEIEIDRADGSVSVVSVSSGPIRGASGELLAGVVTWSDVTVRRNADALRDTFMSVLSHELRTPVTTIYGGALVLSNPTRSIPPETRAEMLADIAAEAERLQQMIENLLAFARIERGVVPIDAQPVLVQRLLERVVADEQRRWATTMFSVSAPPGLPSVAGDDALIELALRNLLSNAAKYGPAGGLVEVVAERDERGVVVRVRDHGPGVPEGEEASIFHVFYRSKRTSTAAPGAGIGLFVVRSLVEQMRGEIWATNREGGGAEFAFRLPIFEE